jgi:type IV pilus assembly protein PilF
MTISIRARAVLLGLALAASIAACTTQEVVVPVSGAPDRINPTEEADAKKRAHARVELASAYFSRGEMKTALDQVKVALAADPQSGDAYNLRGLIYSSMGDHALAEASFRQALQINPRDADTMHNYAWTLCQQKRYPESFEMFHRALAVQQYRGAARTLLAEGVCHAFAGQLAEAEASLSHAYELDPTSPFTATNLAEVLYRRGEYQRARFYVRRVNSQPTISSAQTLWLAARIENKLGNKTGATDFGYQLRNRFPDSPEAALFARGAFDE